MKLIRPNCRLRFTSTDFDFLISALCDADSSPVVRRLMTDPDALDLLLDEERVYQALLDRPDGLGISSHFFFYVLVRHVLKQAGLNDRTLSDYVAELLAEFSRMDRARPPLPPDHEPSDYLVDVVAAMSWANDEEQFALRTHIGNISLFMAGVFPERIMARTRNHAAPRIDYYEDMGRSSFRVAGHHRLAERYDMGAVLCELSEAFHETRIALNELKDHTLHIEPPPFMVA